MDKLMSTLDLIKSEHDVNRLIIVEPLLFQSDSNHTQTTATLSEFDDDTSLLNFSNFKLGKLADLDDDFDVLESMDPEDEELTYHPICKAPARKPRKHIISVSPNSYKPPIEIEKPLCVEILKNSLKER